MESARFQPLTEVCYRQLTEGGRVLEADHHGTKLISLRDGRYLKLFRRKRMLSSALMRPYSRRFERNARRLAELGIPTVAPEALLRVPHLRRTAVLYRPLAGRTLRELLRAGDDERLIGAFGHFLGTLHGRGIYFRSLHFGNLVVTESGAFGLIDVADLDFRPAPLRAALVLRNLRHLMRYPGDWAQVWTATQAFQMGYGEAGRPLPAAAEQLLARNSFHQ